MQRDRGAGRGSGAARADATGSAAAIALRLAMGRPIDGPGTIDWGAVHRVAASEYLVVLAWLRSGRAIRAHASAELSARWRRAVLANDAHGRRQLAAAADALATLRSAGVDATLLKGIPLAQRLYGEPFVRCTSDIDLFVDERSRMVAAHALDSLGWRRTSGAPPWHEARERRDGSETLHLELHSSIVCDHLRHLPVPAAAAAAVEVAGVAMPAHDGPLLAAQLAVHLATHQLPSLLWMLDFHTLWTLLGRDERGAALAAARSAGLHRYLDWAIGRSTLLSAAADGEREALAALGMDATGRRDVHSIVRHVALAPSPIAALRVVAACAFPRPQRTSLSAYLAGTSARIRVRGRSLLGQRRDYGLAPDGARPLRLERGELLELLRELGAMGRGVWVRAPGGSMLPTIPRGARVWLAPPSATTLSPGAVVLAVTDEGEPVLHRIVEVHADGTLCLRGDSALAFDPVVRSSDVIAEATHVLVDGETRRIAPSPSRTVGARALAARRRLAVLAHGGR